MSNKSYFVLPADEQLELLAFCQDKLGRTVQLLEKDAWVVWTLSKIFSAEYGKHLTFKGGTSLSKAYGVINRFSEDIDLTVDIRHLLPDLTKDGNTLPPSNSQERKWTDQLKDALPTWIAKQIVPHLREELEKDEVEANVRQVDDKVYLEYPSLKVGEDYVKPAVFLEFGARATGEPNQPMPVRCYMADAQVLGVNFPSANPIVMKIERTFWEKATAAHVFCLQDRLRGERYARHWYDLVRIASSEHGEAALAAKDIAREVAAHKAVFFREKSLGNTVIDYKVAVNGSLRLVPKANGLQALREDFDAMGHAGLLAGPKISFDELMDECRALEARANAA